MARGQINKLPHLDRGETEKNNLIQASQYDMEVAFASGGY
jgi:hypothetical protein